MSYKRLNLEISSYDGSGRVINGKVKRDFGVFKPSVDGAIHLNLFTGIFGSWLAGMSFI